MTCVDRATRRFTGWAVAYERDPETMQSVVDAAPPARRYFSDGFNGYPTLVYSPGEHAVAPGKSQTYSVEGNNAELRHYLARLARRSRCFSRCLWALARAVSLFVYAWNRRQAFKRKFPKLPAHVSDFVADLL